MVCLSRIRRSIWYGLIRNRGSWKKIQGRNQSKESRKRIFIIHSRKSKKQIDEPRLKDTHACYWNWARAYDWGLMPLFFLQWIGRSRWVNKRRRACKIYLTVQIRWPWHPATILACYQLWNCIVVAYALITTFIEIILRFVGFLDYSRLISKTTFKSSLPSLRPKTTKCNNSRIWLFTF